MNLLDSKSAPEDAITGCKRGAARRKLGKPNPSAFPAIRPATLYKHRRVGDKTAETQSCSTPDARKLLKLMRMPFQSQISLDRPPIAIRVR